MDKIKTAPKRRPSTSKPLRAKQSKIAMKTKGAIKVTIKEDANVTELDPIANLLNPDLIGSAIMQCLIKNDPERCNGNHRRSFIRTE